MSDLEKRTGVHRETIRVYFRHGLLPEPERPAPNVADYGETHVQAMLAVRKLQRDDGLTLPQIKEAIRGQNSEGRVNAAAFRNLETLVAARVGMAGAVLLEKIGRGTWRDGVCQYVWCWVVSVALQTNK